MFFGFFRALRRGIKDPSFRIILVIALVHITTGTVFYTLVEHWRVLDSLYFCVVTLTTVGFGDFYPQTDLGKIFTMFYIVTGIGELSAFIAGIYTCFCVTKKRPGRFFKFYYFI